MNTVAETGSYQDRPSRVALFVALVTVLACNASAQSGAFTDAELRDLRRLSRHAQAARQSAGTETAR